MPASALAPESAPDAVPPSAALSRWRRWSSCDSERMSSDSGCGDASQDDASQGEGPESKPAGDGDEGCVGGEGAAVWRLDHPKMATHRRRWVDVKLVLNVTAAHLPNSEGRAWEAQGRKVQGGAVQRGASSHPERTHAPGWGGPGWGGASAERRRITRAPPWECRPMANHFIPSGVPRQSSGPSKHGHRQPKKATARLPCSSRAPSVLLQGSLRAPGSSRPPRHLRRLAIRSSSEAGGGGEGGV